MDSQVAVILARRRHLGFQDGRYILGVAAILVPQMAVVLTRRRHFDGLISRRD